MSSEIPPAKMGAGDSREDGRHVTSSHQRQQAHCPGKSRDMHLDMLHRGVRNGSPVSSTTPHCGAAPPFHARRLTKTMTCSVGCSTPSTIIRNRNQRSRSTLAMVKQEKKDNVWDLSRLVLVLVLVLLCSVPGL